MHKFTVAMAVIASCLAVLLSACQSLPPAPGNTPTKPVSEFRPDAEYLSYLRSLASATPTMQKQLHQQATQAYEQQANPHNQLRLALTLSQLDAPHGNAGKARQLYKELLANGPQLSPGLETMVVVQINELNRRIVLGTQLNQLQQELDTAKAKIQALTTIEKTLEQPTPETKASP